PSFSHVLLDVAAEEAVERRVDDRRGDHQPDDARGPEAPHEIVQRLGTHRPLACEGLHGGRDGVVHHELVAAAHQPSHHVGPHAPETNHAHLHIQPLLSTRRTKSRPSQCSAWSQKKVKRIGATCSAATGMSTKSTPTTVDVEAVSVTTAQSLMDHRRRNAAPAWIRMVAPG